jgi:hypothetical protein
MVHAFMIILSLWGRSLIAQQTPPATFQITVSLPKPTIHVGDNLVIQVITSNPTDHIVLPVLDTEWALL